MRRVISTFLILVLSFAVTAKASETLENDIRVDVSVPKPFVRWKEQQVINAQNKVVRLSNLLLLIKSEKNMPENTLPQVAKENKQEINIPENQQKELVEHTESQLKEAVASLDFVRELTLNDYFSVYLQQFKQKPEALVALASEMDKVEIAEILLSIISTKNLSLSATQPIKPTTIPESLDKEPVKNSNISAKRTPSEL